MPLEYTTDGAKTIVVYYDQEEELAPVDKSIRDAPISFGAERNPLIKYVIYTEDEVFATKGTISDSFKKILEALDKIAQKRVLGDVEHNDDASQSGTGIRPYTLVNQSGIVPDTLRRVDAPVARQGSVPPANTVSRFLEGSVARPVPVQFRSDVNTVTGRPIDGSVERPVPVQFRSPVNTVTGRPIDGSVERPGPALRQKVLPQETIIPSGRSSDASSAQDSDRSPGQLKQDADDLRHYYDPKKYPAQPAQTLEQIAQRYGSRLKLEDGKTTMSLQSFTALANSAYLESLNENTIPSPDRVELLVKLFPYIKSASLQASLKEVIPYNHQKIKADSLSNYMEEPTMDNLQRLVRSIRNQIQWMQLEHPQGVQISGNDTKFIKMFVEFPGEKKDPELQKWCAAQFPAAAPPDRTEWRDPDPASPRRRP